MGKTGLSLTEHSGNGRQARLDDKQRSSPFLFVWQAPPEVEEIEQIDHRKPLGEQSDQAQKALHRIRWDTFVGRAVPILSHWLLCSVRPPHSTLAAKRTSKARPMPQGRFSRWRDNWRSHCSVWHHRHGHAGGKPS